LSAVVTLTAAEVRPLRRRVLRPHQAEAELVYPGDDAPGTLHAGIRDGGALVGIATISREPMPGCDAPDAWRVRGMATAPEARGRGHGAALLEACLTHAAAQGGRRAWCNARTPAAGFYARHGFAVRGEEFVLPGIGPHLLMWRELGAPRPSAG
jgi:GNAT superfamily N-acetyltransferase